MNAAQRRWLATAVGTLGCAVALALAQLLAARSGWRLDLSPEQRFVLSPHARQVLGGLEQPVTVTGFLRADDPRNAEIEDLLRRVHAVAPLVATRVVDVNRNPALARELGVDSYGAVVVESGGRRRDFANPDEQTLMAAIIQVTRPARRRVYVSTGHGERRLGDRDRQVGYSQANVALINERYEVGEVALDAETPVPADAAALIVAGPRRDLRPAALQQIDAYLRRGGRVLVLLDPGDAPNLAPLLQRYGIVVGDELVLDGEQRMFAGDYLTMQVPTRAAAHPVTAGLGAAPLMSGIRPVRSAGGDGRLDVLATGSESWRTPDRAALQSGVGEFVAGRDTPGPVPVGASASVPAESGEPGRLLVYGDADFASNLLLGYLGNRDLLLNSVNWLSGEESLLGARPPAQIPGVNQLFVSAVQGERVFWLGSVVQPALVLALGVAVAVARRRRG
ncbi:MAG: GldG family protein [Candidatus Binatia bacterium]